MIQSVLNCNFLFAMPGGTELLFILAVILLFFGGKKIPQLMGGIGRGIKEFNEGKDHVKKEIGKDLNKKEK
jgi:sec-independent protein translocase protein TatA